MLLLLDFQPIILAGLGDRATAVVSAANRAIDDATRAGLLVAFVRMAFQPGHPEVNDRNKLFSMMKRQGLMVDGTEPAALDSRLAIPKGAPVFTKSRVSPFGTTQLGLFITENNVTKIVIGGVVGAVVLSTVRECFDRDLEVTLLEECCDDRLPERNVACMNHILPHDASIVSVEDWSAALVVSGGSAQQTKAPVPKASIPTAVASAEEGSLLLLLDLQPGIIAGLGDHADGIVNAANEAVAAATRAGSLVAFVRVAFQPGHPEVNDRNKLFSMIKRNDLLVDGSDAAGLHPRLTVPHGAPVFTKTRISPFGTTELGAFMTEHRVTTVAIGGVATGAVVLSAVRECFDRDLEVTVLKDCCADRLVERHAACMDHIFPSDATLMTVSEWARPQGR